MGGELPLASQSDALGFGSRTTVVTATAGVIVYIGAAAGVAVIGYIAAVGAAADNQSA